ncbi:MAG TPA: hypothetical protein VE999_03565 [Gemmataceae bacterium]|nr:hypothetical protein [Gemmataceae bacterium]
MRGEGARIGKRARRRRNEIAFDSKDEVRRAEIEKAFERPAECLLDGGELIVAVKRLPLMPTRRRELLLQSGDLRCKRGGRHRAG